MKTMMVKSYVELTVPAQERAKERRRERRAAREAGEREERGEANILGR